jgi:chromosomal replication initiator protein
MSETQSELCNPCIEHPEYLAIDKVSKRLNSNEIVKAVSEFFQIPVEEIKGKKRFARIAEARMLTSYVLRKDRYLDLGFLHIANILGGKDHSTIMHHIKQVDTLMSVEPDFKERVRNLFIYVYGSTKYFY